MPSLYAHMMNLVFRCMPQDKPGQSHDYAAERKRNDRKPPRPPKGVTVRLGELDGLSAEFIQKTAIRRERSSTFTAADLLSALPGSGGQSASTLLDIRHGVCHAFQVFTAMPEARQALDVVFRTLEEWA